MTEPQRPPRDNIVRAIFPGVEVREAADGGMPTLHGRFSPYNEWTLIRSSVEGTFMERFAPGSFSKAISEGGFRVKVLFQHGKDPNIGEKPLGPPTLREDADGAYYEVPMLDTAYNRELIPGLQAGLYGASHRFSVVKEDVTRNPARSAWNPEGITERTVREARLMELGPVTFPAYAGSTAGIRSMTDEYQFATLTADPDRLRELVDNALPRGAEAEPHSDPESREDPAPPPAPTPPEPPQEKHPVSEYVTRDEKAARIAELRSSITRRATEFEGVLPPDVQAADDKENAEHDQLQRDIAAWDARQARLRAFAEDVTRTEDGTYSPPAPYAPPSVIRRRTDEDIHDLGAIRSETRSREEYDARVTEHALRSIDSASHSAAVRGGNLEALVDLVEHRDEGDEGKGEVARRILATGSPVYRRAFNKYLKGQKDLWSPEESRAAALAVTATTTTGGYAVPYVFDPTLIRIGVWTEQNPFRAACRTVTITNGNVWKAVTVGAITMAYGTEALALSEGGPTFGQPSYQVQTAAGFVTLSVETMEDRPDITGELTQVFQEGKDTLEENQFAVGTGATVYPKGMFYAASYTATNSATNDVTALADTQLVEAALPLRFRAKAEWFMNRSTMRQLMALDTGWRYFSGAGIQFPGNQNPERNARGNTGIKLLGYDVWEVPSAVSTLTTDQALLACLVDPSSFIIVDRIGMNVEVIPQMLNGATPSFPTLQRGIVAYWRNYAAPINADAGRMLRVQ